MFCGKQNVYTFANRFQEVITPESGFFKRFADVAQLARAADL